MSKLSELGSRLSGGEAAIADDPARIAPYAATTLPQATLPSGVVFPLTAADVQVVVQFAREHRLSLHPVSRGKNWGYGDALAPRDGCLIVDLSRMNRIVEVNERLGFAVIEPGVSQGQLAAYLQEKHGGLWMDTNGAGPDVSLVGNFLERGFGHTPLGNRPAQVSGLEVVLGTGELVRTGFGHFEGAKTTHTYPYGIGPSLDGLFFQSSYGIVTRMGIWLMPRPEAFEGFYCRAEEDSDLAPLLEKLVWLRRHRVVTSCVHVLDPLRSLMKRVAYPWSETGGRRPVSPETRLAWRHAFGVGAWNATGGLYGPSTVVAAGRHVVHETLRPFRCVEVSEASIARLRARPEDGNLLAQVESAFRFLRGVPTSGALPTAGWRSRRYDPGELDPIRNGAGLMWLVPALPATGEDAVAVARLLRGTMEPYGFDVPMTFTLINERTITCTSNISFNREDPEDTKAAVEAHREACRKLIEAGYPPYRSGIGAFDLLANGSTFWETARKLKQVLDPDGIISPGHYFA